MYESHFGITAAPFQLSPDPGFYFDSRGHRAARQALREGLAQAHGHLVLTGEIGAGKTLLVAALLGELDEASTVVARLVSTHLDGDGLLRAVASALGAERRSVDRAADALQSVDACLSAAAAAGRRLIVLVDEAQNLDDAAFGRLAELDALPANAAGVLTICLVGQPELRQRLTLPACARLAGRIAVACHLGPLGKLECGAYIAHRLERVGWTGRPGFDPGAIDVIFRWTAGIPRRVNQLCDRLLLAAFLDTQERIDAALVETVAAELRGEIGDAAGLSTVPGSTAESPPAASRPIEILLPEPMAPLAPVADVPLGFAPVATDAADADAAPPQPPLSLHLLPIGDVAPQSLQAEAPVPPGVRYPSFAPWPSIPSAAVPPLHTQPPRLETAVEMPRPAPAILCVAGSVSEHAQAAALLRAIRAATTLPTARLVRAFVNDALDSTRRLFYPKDLAQAGALGVSPAGSHAERAADLVTRFDAFLERQSAEVVIVFDGGEAALACALAASRRKVPVLRVGAGRRSKDGGVKPADLKRKLSDQMADMLYTADSEATSQVTRDGMRADRVSLVGSVLADALQFALLDTAGARVDAELAAAVAQVGRKRAGYAVTLIDARQHLQDRRLLTELVTMLADLSRDLPLLWTMPASTREQLLAMGLAGLIDGARIVCLPMQTYTDFARLVAGATCVLTDSWTLQEECTVLEVPCLTVGTAPAHPTTVTDGSNVFVGLNQGLATRTVWDCIFSGGKRPVPPRLWDGHAGDRIAGHLAGWLSRTRAARA